jgi:hypothetical protein
METWVSLLLGEVASPIEISTRSTVVGDEAALLCSS